MSNVSDRTEDALWRMYNEHCTHMRHHETQRSTVAASLIAIAGALLGVATFDRALSPTDFPILIMVFALGLFGALFSAKQYERSAMQMQRARSYRNAIDEHLAGQPISALKWSADKRHNKEFPILHRFKLNKFWLGLYIFVSVAGLSMAAIAIAPSRTGIASDSANSQSEVSQVMDNQVGRPPVLSAPTRPEGEGRYPVPATANSSLSIPIGLLGFVVVLVLGAFLWIQRQRAETSAVNSPIANRNSGGVSLVSALTAMGVAWVAIGKVEDGWKVALPALTAPLLTLLAAQSRLPLGAKWWALGLGVSGSLFFVVAHLIDRAVRWQPADWGGSFLHNSAALLAKLSFADYGAIFVALLAYGLSLKGAVGVDARR